MLTDSIKHNEKNLDTTSVPNTESPSLDGAPTPSRKTLTFSEAVIQNAIERGNLAKENPCKHGGFSLVELVIVIAIASILGYLYISGARGSDDNAKAVAMKQVTQSMTNVFTLASMSCGTGSNIESSALSSAGTAAGNVTVILTGQGLNPTYEACFDSSGAKPLNGASKGSAGNERVLNYRVSASMVGSNKIAWTFIDVPEKIALAGFQKFSSATGAGNATTLPSSGDMTDPYYRFGAVSSGLTNVTFIVSI